MMWLLVLVLVVVIVVVVVVIVVAADECTTLTFVPLPPLQHRHSGLEQRPFYPMPDVHGGTCHRCRCYLLVVLVTSRSNYAKAGF